MEEAAVKAILIRGSNDESPNLENPWEDDKLDRKAVADFLYKILKDSHGGITLNVDSSWGNGKTFFLSRWKEDLKKSKHPVVFFNAWEADYFQDPFIPLIAEISTQLEAQIQDQTIVGTLKSLVKTGGRFLQNAVPLVTTIASRAALGDEGVKKVKDILSPEAEKDVASFLGKCTEQAIDQYSTNQGSIKEFKKKFLASLTPLSSKGRRLPLFIFVDELDRCRPSFSVSLLERIKHLLNVPETIFVIATDTTNLKASIKSIYGDNFDADVYLRRFFDQTFRLPLASAKEFYVKVLFSKFPFTDLIKQNKILSYSDTGIPKEQVYLPEDIFTEYSKTFVASLRDQEQCFFRLLACLKILSDLPKIHFPYLCFLVFSQHFYPDEYFAFSCGKTSPEGFWAKIVGFKGLKQGDELPPAIMTAQSYFSFKTRSDATHAWNTMTQALGRGIEPRPLTQRAIFRIRTIQELSDFFDLGRHRAAVDLAIGFE